ncbi:MAG: hypothetical protein MJK14_05755 [Rivularia sp. ALOHA_DT_140]|nr:hypothetical protein [Rivularia sp. ALOHA_DT_140]
MLLKDKIHPVAVLEEAIIVSQQFLSQFAESDVFLEKVTSIFGNNFDSDKLSYFRQSWLNANFESLPEIEIRSQQELDGANGAFAVFTNKIYLSEEYIAQNGFNSGAIVNVLLEEIGHFVDASINEIDTTGDEGEIFSAIVQGVELDKTAIKTLNKEDDTAVIYLDNQLVQIEQQNEKISLSSFLDQTEALLKGIQSSINQQIFSGGNVPNIGNLDGLPLFGDSLENNDETKFLEALSEEIREKHTDRFGGVDNVSPQDIQQALSDIFGYNSPIIREGSEIIFDFNINREKIFQTTLPNDIGLPQLDLSYEPNPTASVNLNYIIDSGIGIDLATSEFLFDIYSDKDISISLEPSLPKNTEARMGFLLVDAKDIGSQLDLDIDLKGAEDHITLDDIENIEALPEGDASVNLNLQSTADISNIDSLNSLPTIRKLPQLGTDLKINWNFEENGFAPTVKFSNFTVEVGSLIVDLLRPIIKEVRNITEPFGKIYGFLKTEIPVLNKLGFSNATLLGLANNSADLPGLASLTDLGIAGIDLIGQVDELIGSLGNTIDNLEDLKFDIGDVSLGEFDLRNIFSNFDEAEIEDSRNQALQTLVDSIPLSSDYDDYRKFFDTFLDDQLKQILSLPILENPETIAKLFLGQAFENVTSGERVKFLEFKLPQINTILETTDRFSFPGLPVKFGFGGSIDVNILPTKLSYDSLGLEKWASKEIDFDPNQASVLFDGLLVDDNRDNGVDKPEAKIDGRIFATSPEIGIPFILGVGIDGGIKASIFADIEDLGEVGNDLGDSDGQIRGSEILAIARVNPDCLIELGGQIDAFLGGYIRYFFKKKRKDLVSIKLGDFDISSCPGHKPTLANEGPENFDGGILELNIGPQANKRLVVSTTDNDETFFVTGNGSNNNETVRVIAFGYSQSFSGVNQILANAGESDDSIEVENIAIPVEFSGGNGNDRLFGGNSNDFLSGDAGNDKLFGRSGNDLLLGSDGNDLIFAGDGNDSVSGGSNSDVLNLLLPGDELFGEGGADTIDGGAGSDYIDGGIGNDTLFGDTDDTQLGNDTIFGDDGKDKIYGFRGNDVLVGGNGSDLIYGGSGNDKLVGDLDEEDNGNDFLRGDAGNDEISGSNGNDTVIYDTSPNGVVVNIDEKQNYTSFAIEPDFTVNASEAKDGFGFTDSFQVAIIVDSNLDENGQIFDLETRNISGNLENIIASQQDDILIGNSSDNKIEALEGNDLLIEPIWDLVPNFQV